MDRAYNYHSSHLKCSILNTTAAAMGIDGISITVTNETFKQMIIGHMIFDNMLKKRIN